jgi:hypothetical protein
VATRAEIILNRDRYLASLPAKEAAGKEARLRLGVSEATARRLAGIRQDRAGENLVMRGGLRSDGQRPE